MTKLGMPNGMVRLGDAIKKIRGNQSRIELATISGVSAKTIDDIENGRNPNPTIGTLLAICGARGVSPIDFLREAYPDLHKPETIIVENRDAISLSDLDLLINGFSRASFAKRGLVRMILSSGAAVTPNHFRDGGKISTAAYMKLKELLGVIEKLIRDDQASRV